MKKKYKLTLKHKGGEKETQTIEIPVSQVKNIDPDQLVVFQVPRSMSSNEIKEMKWNAEKAGILRNLIISDEVSVCVLEEIPEPRKKGELSPDQVLENQIADIIKREVIIRTKQGQPHGMNLVGVHIAAERILKWIRGKE